MSEPGRFRKKPAVIEAMQWRGFEETPWKALYDFCKDERGVSVLTGPHPPLGGQSPDNERCSITTLEGTMFADRGDWIIRGVKGEFYPCKPDIFDATYEPADPPPVPTAGRTEATKVGMVITGVQGRGMSYQNPGQPWVHACPKCERAPCVCAPSPAEEPRPCGRIFAPWTRAQVAALNDYQESGAFHPFTCGNRDTRPHHDYAAANNAPDHGILVATLKGWTCPSCDYTQDWAHNFMADRHSWTRPPAPYDPPQPERITDHAFVCCIAERPEWCALAVNEHDPTVLCHRCRQPRSAHERGEGGR